MSNAKFLKKIPLCWLVLLLFVASSSRGQTGRAMISGSVTDQSSRDLEGVEVTAQNVATGATTAMRTNQAGKYALLDLAVGTYVVKFRKSGFQGIDFTEISLSVDQVAQVNAQLKVGLSVQTMTVTASQMALDKETSTIGTNLTANIVSDLPLNIYGGRAIETFALAITPGYSPLSSPYNAVINGTQTFTKDFTVDGTSATAQIQGDSLETGPSMEAVTELRAETSGLSAANAMTDGGVVMFRLKSGTNVFHGSGFVFGHNEALDANTFDNNLLGLPKPEARFWDWGLSSGGPIRKNKIFIFGAFERFTQHDFTLGGFGDASTVPTAEFLDGNLGALLDTSRQLGVDRHGNPIFPGSIFNPQDPGAVFVGNLIPATMVSAVSQKIISLYAKNYPPESSSLIENDRMPINNSPSQSPNQIVVKADEIVGERDRLSASWVFNHRPRTLNDSGGVWAAGQPGGGPLADSRDQLVYSHEFRASESHALRPSLLNVADFTYNWYWNGSRPATGNTDWPVKLGFGSTGAPNFPSINFGNPVNGFDETAIGNAWQGYYVGATGLFADTLSWTHGRHLLTVGGNWRAMEINSHTGSGALSFNFSNNATGAPTAPYAGEVGFGFASFLLGDVQSASATTPLDLYGRRKAAALFIQDNYRATRRLSLNFGLRWDYSSRFHEKYGHWANFDLGKVDPTLGIPGTLVYAGSGSQSFEKYEDGRNFGPEFGFAFAPRNSWVIRGSVGLTYVPIGIQYYAGVPYGFAPGYRGTNAAPGPFQWDGGYPGKFLPGTMSSTPDANLYPIVSVDPHALDDGYTENLNLGTEYAINRNIRIEASYIGNRGHRLEGSNLAYNEADPASFFNLVQSGNASVPVCDASTAASIGVPYPFAGFCGPAFAAIAPYPQLAAAAAYSEGYPNLYYVGLNRGQSFYDSMVIEIEKHSGKGLIADLNYTLSRQSGDTFTNFGDSYAVALNGIQDMSNLKEAAHTLSPYDQKNVLKGLVAYQLPLGSGKKFLSGDQRVLRGILGGWKLSAIVTYASGAPLGFYSPNIYDFYPGWSAIYVNYHLGNYHGRTFKTSDFVEPTGTDSAPPGNVYFPSSVVSNPGPGQLGSGPSRIGTLRGFGLRNENAGLLKYFRFGTDERYQLSLRIEFYNLFNRNTFANPNTTVGSPLLGYVTGSTDNPRQGQFGARFEW